MTWTPETQSALPEIRSFDGELACPNGRPLAMYAVVEVIDSTTPADMNGVAVSIPSGAEFRILGVADEQASRVWLEADDDRLPAHLQVSVALSGVKSVYDR